MTFIQVMKHFGSYTAIAQAAARTENAVRMWEHRGLIPVHAQRMLEEVTRGKLKSDSTAR